MFKLSLEKKISPPGGSGGQGGPYNGVKWDYYRYPIFTFPRLLKPFGQIYHSYGV